MKFRKIVITMFVIISLIIFMLMAVGCDKNSPIDSGRSAIIIIPGIQGSVLYDPETNESVWAAETGNDVMQLANSLETGKMDFHEDGYPANEISMRLLAPDFFTAPDNWKYGVNLEQLATIPALGLTPTVIKGLVLSIEDKYKDDDTDVLVYQYDWRQSNVTEAEKLEKYINDHNYTDVKFVVHSMGGILASQYLARSQSNIERCSLFVSISTPYLGSSEITKYLVTNKLPGSIFSLKIGVNYPSAFEILPFIQFNETEHFESHQTSLIVDGDYKSYDEAIEFFKTGTSWGKKADGSPKIMFNSLSSYYQAMFLSDGSHITSLVNSYYIQGTGRPTTVTVSFEDGNYIAENDIKQDLGDGIVPLYSGICGLSVDAENVILIQEDPSLPNDEGYVGHMALPSQPRTIEEVLRLLELVIG
ncbi:MAG: hypothetical protein LBF68_00155 [Christensenellaceae bacterium]|jgi:pimeloyl-ACP methyl ester carboxylesterase|nr:hypothetical protein [Christensenellaceae bacterium]